jgi:hypothetical protein
LNNVYSLPALSPAGGPAGADRYSYEQRLAEGLNQGSEDRAFARPRQAELAALATATKGDAGHVGVQPGLTLKEVKMSRGAAQAVMDGLSGSASGRTGYDFSSAPSLESMRQRVMLSSTLSTFQGGARPKARVNDASIPSPPCRIHPSEASDDNVRRGTGPRCVDRAEAVALVGAATACNKQARHVTPAERA